MSIFPWIFLTTAFKVYIHSSRYSFFRLCDFFLFFDFDFLFLLLRLALVVLDFSLSLCSDSSSILFKRSDLEPCEYEL